MKLDQQTKDTIIYGVQSYSFLMGFNAKFTALELCKKILDTYDNFVCQVIARTLNENQGVISEIENINGSVKFKLTVESTQEGN